MLRRVLQLTGILVVCVATMGQQAPTPAPQGPSPSQTPLAGQAAPAEQTPPAKPRQDEALVLLERMQTLVDDALAERPSAATGAVGTSGKGLGKSGKVYVDRATLDELRAELAQLKVMLELNELR